jgi:hypothetical protein
MAENGQKVVIYLNKSYSTTNQYQEESREYTRSYTIDRDLNKIQTGYLIKR